MIVYLRQIINFVEGTVSKIGWIMVAYVAMSILEAVSIGLAGPYIAFMVTGSIGQFRELSAFLPFTIPDANTENLMVISGVFLVFLFAFKATMIFWLNRVVIVYGQEQLVSIRSRLIAIYQSMSGTKLKSSNHSEYINIITSVCPSFTNLLMAIVQLFGELVIALVLISMLIWTDAFAFFILFILLSACLVLTDRFVKNRVIKAGRKTNQSSAGILRSLGELFDGIRELKIYGKRNQFSKQVTDASKAYSEAQVDVQLFSILPKCVVELVVIVFLILFLMVSAFSGVERDVLVVTMGVYGMVAIRLLPFARSFSATLIRLRSNAHSVELLTAAFERTTSVDSDEITIEPNFANPSKTGDINIEGLELQNLSFRHSKDSDFVVDDVNLVIKKGDRIGLVGESGSGKTTLVNILTGMLSATSGNVLLDGKDVTQKPAELWEKISYLPQEIFIFDGSVKDNVTLRTPSNLVDEEDVTRALKRARAYESVMALPNQLDTILGQDGNRLSGGQRQRIALARAFYFDRKLIILDEATSAVSERMEEEVVEEILSDEGDLTVICISHNPATIRNFDREFRLEHGHLISVRDK